MSSVIVQVNSESWTELTDAKQSGSYLVIGNNSVYIYQGTTAPLSAAGVAPMMDIIQSSHPKPYYGVGSESLFARTVSGTAILHLTPEG